MDLRDLKGLEIAARRKLVWENGACVVPSQTRGSARCHLPMKSWGVIHVLSTFIVQQAKSAG
jgi:hypothetical protein